MSKKDIYIDTPQKYFTKDFNNFLKFVEISFTHLTKQSPVATMIAKHK